MNLAPIALFCYKRLDQLQQTVESLSRNELASESHLYVFSDGPATQEDIPKVRAVREYLHSVTGFKNVTIIGRGPNFGEADAIITGVTEIVNIFGRIIVLEDDLVTSPHFLRYMNEALELYEEDDTVASIQARSFAVQSGLPETFFIKGAGPGAWGTWRPKWKAFEADGKSLLDQLESRKLSGSFDFDDCYPYTSQLADVAKEKSESWGIRWYAAAFLKEMLTLYPARSLVRGIAEDSILSPGLTALEASGTPVTVARIPVVEDAAARNAIGAYLKTARPTFSQSIVRSLGKLTKRIKPNG